MVRELTEWDWGKCRLPTWKKNSINSVSKKSSSFQIKNTRQACNMRILLLMTYLREGMPSWRTWLEKWASGNLMELNKKGQGPGPGSGQSQTHWQLGWRRVWEQPWEKDLGIVVVEELAMSWQWVLPALEASGILGYIQRSVASKLREGILPLYSALSSPGVLHTVLVSPA